MTGKFDPQLHILRSVAASLDDPKQRHEAETARFNLFVALREENEASALEWLEALEISLKRAYPELDAGTADSVRRAMTKIREGVTQ